jgi:AraC-like DNA-binding protein
MNALMVPVCQLAGSMVVRIQRKRMLLNLDLNVSEIAYTVVFQSLTQFSRLFR